ncbi:hypothetical protein NC651_026572 [Populus alba x Populus x berolinensis]|nr:hypothetical protein NC651_026572 [Populus alba x Populus x berolinensis]
MDVILSGSLRIMSSCRYKLASVINLFPSFTATVKRFVLLPKSGEGYPFQQTNSTALYGLKNSTHHFSLYL